MSRALVSCFVGRADGQVCTINWALRSGLYAQRLGGELWGLGMSFLIRASLFPRGLVPSARPSEGLDPMNSHHRGSVSVLVKRHPLVRENLFLPPPLGKP